MAQQDGSVRFATTVASGHATLATKRMLLLTWAGLSPAGSHQLAAGAPTQSPHRRAEPLAKECVSGLPCSRECCLRLVEGVRNPLVAGCGRGQRLRASHRGLKRFLTTESCK